MNYFLLVLATLAASGKALFCKLVGSARGRNAFFVNFKSFSVAFLAALILSARELEHIFDISLFSLLLALAFGFSVAFTQFTQMKAMNEGPASLTTLIYSSAFLIPIVFSYFVWDDPISIWQLMGIIILLGALALIVIEPGSGGANVNWLIFVGLASLGSGANAILQKTHQKSIHSAEIKLFLVYALLFSALFCLAVYIIYRPKSEKGKEENRENKNVMALLFPVFLGVSVAFLNFLNLKLAGVLPAAIQFPIYNVGSLILTSAVSVVAFREKLGIRKIVGYVIGIGAILMVGLL